MKKTKPNWKEGLIELIMPLIPEGTKIFRDDYLQDLAMSRNVGHIKQGDVVTWQSPYQMGTYTAECDQVGPVPSGTFYATVNGKAVIKL